MSGDQEEGRGTAPEQRHPGDGAAQVPADEHQSLTLYGTGFECRLSSLPVVIASARAASPMMTTPAIAPRSRPVRAVRSCQMATSAAAAQRQSR